MSDDDITIDQLRERLDDVRVAMATTIDEHGLLSSRPLTVQRIDDSSNVYFIVARDAGWAIEGQAMNVAMVEEGRTWVSVVGRAHYVTGTSLISDLWDDVTDQFFPDGMDGAVVLQVLAERWEYWTAPNKLGQLAGMAKAFLMDSQPDLGESGTVDT